MLAVLVVGLLMNAVALPLAGLRILFLYRTISHGQPAPERIKGVTSRLGAAVKRQVVEVFGQKKMLKWTVPGSAHFFVMWAFFILATVYLEAYAVLLSRDPEWSWFVFGNWSVLGFLQDFIAVMAALGLVVFYVIRLRNRPQDQGRRSRFFGSHLGPAYFTLLMIFNVIWTMFLFRGAVEARDMAVAAAGGGDQGYGKAAFVSYLLGKVLPDSTALIGIGLLLHIGVMLVFLIFVLNSKHLHIFLAPMNVLFGREPVALGAAKPMTSGGKALTLEDLEDIDEDAKLGVGAAEDFTWKGVLDMATCTECGRCQSQCPAWNTEKPLSPKLMIMALRDHTMAKSPYLLADETKRESMLEGNAKLATELERPLVGDTGDEWFYMPEDGSGVIDPDVLWSCVTCGACVQQCPVDIEHVDHIIDMRRYQVLVESNFPAELNSLFKGMENKGNPWNMSSTARLDWTKDLPFDVKVVGEDIDSLDEVEWLFWVGCAGAYEDRAKKTTRAVAELLHMAGVSFGVLGNGETCNGDSARRAGNEFVFQGLAAQNIETFKEYKVKKAVTTCAHCFNTLKNEYRQLGIQLDVVHHTQLLNRLVREKKLTPVRTPERSFNGPHRRPITYHDPCYLGRHNQVYEAPRELLNVLPDARFVEMPRNSERSFCCGAGGARMWMEETIGTRINETRTKEAVDTGADQIAVACPFCRVMLSDGLTSAQSKGEAREEVEVLDVAQLLLASVKGETQAPKKAAAAASSGGGGTATATIERDEETAAEPEAGDATQSDETVSDTEDVGAAAKASSSGGSSLFDLGDDEQDEVEDKAGPQDGDDDSTAEAAQSVRPESVTTGDDSDDSGSDSGSTGGGSLFDIGDDDDVEQAADEPVDRSEDDADPDVEPDVEPEQDQEKPSSGTESTPSSEIPEGGSLFDIEEPEEVESAPEPDVDRSQDDADTDVAPEEDQEEPEVEAEAEPEAEPASESSRSDGDDETGGLGGKYPSDQSMFDVPDGEPEESEEPDKAAGEDPAGDSTTDDDVDRSQDAADTSTDTSTDDDAPAVTSLKDIKAKFSGGSADEPEPEQDTDDEPPSEEPAPESESEPEPEPEAEADEEPEEKPKPAGSGETHEPKTDTDIGEAGSLFDL